MKRAKWLASMRRTFRRYSSATTRSQAGRNPRIAEAQLLEPRVLLAGVPGNFPPGVTMNLTPDNNRVVINRDGDDVLIRNADGEVFRAPIADTPSLTINGTDEADSIILSLFSTDGLPPMALNGLGGDDTLGGVFSHAQLFLNGGDGDDCLNGGHDDADLG